MNALGRHILVEFSGCSPEIMNSVSTIENAMVDAAQKAGATVINSTFHHFSPYGVSGVVVIQESHLAIHTWPEYGYAAVDLFTCGDEVDPWVSFDFLNEVFEAKNYSAMEMNRGSLKLLNHLDFDANSAREEISNRVNPQKFTRNVWFTDKDDDQALSLRYTGDVLYKEQSDFQEVKVLETYKYGKMLTLDQMVMTTEADEFHYHEMISHPVMNTFEDAKNILVIGGGDGGTVREFLKYKHVENVTMVEIDEKVIEASKLHLPDIAASFDDPRLDLKIADGIQFVNDAGDNLYDLVIVDGSDPVGPAEGLFSVSFYKNCYRVLKNKGVLLTQGESPKFNEKVFADLSVVLKDIFGKENTAVSLFYVPTYPTGMWSFQWGLKGDVCHPNSIDKQSIIDKTNDLELRYYNEDIHHASFALPNFVKKLINE